MELQEGFIVSSRAVKEKILRGLQGFKNYIFLTPEELREKLTFKVSKGALFAIMKKYCFSYGLASEYLDAILRIEDTFYNDPKLDSIVSVYRFLEQDGYLQRDPLFYFRLKQFPLTFIDPDYSKEYFQLKSLVEEKTKVYEYTQTQSHYQHKVYELPTILEECLFVFNQIKDLLRKGVSPKNIYIIHSDESYNFIFKRLAKSYHLSLNFPSSKNILSFPIVQQFLSICNFADDFDTVLEKLNKEDILYDKIVDTIKNYSLKNENPKDCISLLKALFKETAAPRTLYTEAINFATEDILLEDTDYAFYVGFNLGSAPMTCKEQGFINDSDLLRLNYSTSYEKNELAYQRLERFIRATKNLTITYKCSSKTEEFLPSLLIKRMKMEKECPNVEYGYAKLEDELRLSSHFDEYLKYGIAAEDLIRYGVASIPYKTYNHRYKKMDRALLEEHFQNKSLKLAYSNIKLYFACPFSYFADRILNLNEFKPQMAARLGTYAHAVLEDSYATDFNFIESVLKNKIEYSTDAKDEFFFHQMESVLRNLIAFNQQHEAISELKEIKREEHIVVARDGYTFEGFIDKLMYKMVGKEVYAAIVDYKTGSDIVSLDNIADGFHLQLPSYMYLLSNYEPFKGFNLHIIGIYLQKVNIVLFDDKSDIAVQMAKKFMLEGYTVSNTSFISMLDPTFASSTYIKSLGLGRDGFRSYSKIFKEEQQEEIIRLVDDLIEDAAHKIKKGVFDIAPKMIRGKNESCMFCKYKDICFYDYQDIVELPHKPFGKEEK